MDRKLFAMVNPFTYLHRRLYSNNNVDKSQIDNNVGRSADFSLGSSQVLTECEMEMITFRWMPISMEVESGK